MQRIPWPAYSPDVWPIEDVWDLVGWRFDRDPHPTASKDFGLMDYLTHATSYSSIYCRAWWLVTLSVAEYLKLYVQ